MGQIPYGYRIENGAAVIIPAEAAQIRLIFQNYIAGMSLQSAARAAGHHIALFVECCSENATLEMLFIRQFWTKKLMLGQMQSGSIVQM